MSNKHDGLLSIDPSIRACGIAIFDHDKLVYANVLRTSAVVNTLTGISEIMDMAQGAWETTMGVSFSPETLVVEIPQIYQQAQLKGDPNDLIPLSIMAGRLWERFKPKNIMLPLPREWKSQVPKDVMTQRTLAALSKQEVEILGNDLVRIPSGLQHNGFDSIGLGLYALRKLGNRP